MLFFFAVLIVSAVFSTKISSKLGVPVLIAFIGIGILVGSDVLNLFYFSDAHLTKRIADILLIFIPFIGGFQTRKASLRAVAGPALTLATAGVFLTALILGFLIHLLAGLPLLNALMVASIISSTDAAAVMLSTKASPVRDRVSSTLEVESAANDPAAILLTLTFTGLVGGQTGDPWMVALDMVWQLAGGVLVGFIMSKVNHFLFEHLDSDNRGYYYVLIIGAVFLTYGAADLVRANGIIAVFFMGYWLGNVSFPGKRGVGHFLEGIASFSNIALFLMLGLLAFPRQFSGIWQEGLVIAGLLILVVRPLVIGALAAPFKFSIRELTFLSWGGIKGAVPIVLATYPAAAGLDPDGRIFNIIFFVVLLSCLFQGTTMGLAARLLGLTVPPKPKSPHSMELHSMKATEIDLFEISIEKSAWAVGKRIIDLSLPAEIVISTIIRQGVIVPPKGGTVLLPEDILYVLTPTALYNSLLNLLNRPEPSAGTALPETSKAT